MYRAIIVDDEYWVLQGMNNIIQWQEYGFEICKLCMNVTEALEAIDEYHPDIIFTDIRMPQQKGTELLKKVSALHMDILVVIVSAYRDFDVAKQAIINGAFDYLVKPLEKDDVIDLVLRSKAKLDEIKNSWEKTVTEIDLLVEDNQKLDIVKRMFNEAATTSTCYLLLCNKKILPDIFMPGGTKQEIYISGYKKAILYSGVLSIEKDSVVRNIGISAKHSDFSDFSEMLKEAAQSLNGGFIYSENKTVAEIQLSLAERFKEKFILKDIAEEFYLSEAYLFELFRKNTNTTIINFVKNIRMNHAIQLLKYTDVSIKEIADSIGYEDAGYFGRLFRKEYQCSPEQFRKQAQEP